MSDISSFFSPVDMAALVPEELNALQLGSIFTIYKEGSDFPELENADIAIVGIAESRNSLNNEGCMYASNVVRKYLYKLFSGEFNAKILDLGDIKAGHSTEDTYYAVRTTVEALIRKNIVPIMIGGSQDLSYAQFLGYKDLEQTINIVSIDSMFDIGNPDEAINSNSYLGKIILHQPNYLFNFSNIGYQTYLVDPHSLKMMERLFFDVYRLGHVRDKIEDAEPIIRQADMITFDITSIKNSDAPAHPNASPNGFYSEEACQMMRYAGMSDKLSSIGFYELNPEYDINGKTAHLLAQMIWCFLDGFYSRKNDFPSRSNADYLRFHVVLEDKYDINFYKSKKSDRWWMEIPYPSHKDLKFERHTLIPCSPKDYDMAMNNEIPDRWWQTYQKLS